MPEVAALTCTKCGSQLELPQGISQFACGHCGVQHTVNRGGGIVSIEPIVEGLDEIREGTDRTSSELAIGRLNDEMASIKREIQTIQATSGLSSALGSLVGYSIALIGAAFACVAVTAMSDGMELGIILLLLGLGGIVGGGFLVTRPKRKKKKLQSQINSLKQQYGAKAAEIEHHKSIVSMPLRQ